MLAWHSGARWLLLQSQAKKVGIIKKLLAACQGNEAKFIVRSLEGKLRIGLADKTLVVALAHAIVLKGLGMYEIGRDWRPSWEETPTWAVSEEAGGRGRNCQGRVQVSDNSSVLVTGWPASELPNYDLLIPALMKNGVDNLKDICKLTPGQWTV
jgi:DNA ligase-1